jgi:hypothetical protein
MDRRKVLVTGAAGYVAAQMLPTLRERYDCTLIDVTTTDRDGCEVAGVQVQSLLDDVDTLRPLFTGCDAVIHLAFIRRTEDAREHFDGEMDNIRMAYNVFRLSLEENVRRVVMASSNHAADFYEHLLRSREMDMLQPTNDIRPLSDNYYGWAKESYEHLGFVFATGTLGRQLQNVHIRIGAPRQLDPNELQGDIQGYSVRRNLGAYISPRDLTQLFVFATGTLGRQLQNVHIRIGAPRQLDPNELQGDIQGYSVRRNLGAYISPRDLTQLFVKSIETENIENEWGVPWQVFYGISDNTRSFWGLENARRVIGYAPQDDSEVTWARDVYDNLTSKGVVGRVGKAS